VVLVGEEEFLVTRAVEQITAAVRADEPDAAVTERPGSAVTAGELAELLTPSLFAETAVLVIHSGQDVPAASLPVLQAFLADPTPGSLLVLHHSGGAKGKAVLNAAAAVAGARIECARLTRSEERIDFVRAEARRNGATIAADAAACAAVCADLRELATVAPSCRSTWGIDARPWRPHGVALRFPDSGRGPGVIDVPVRWRTCAGRARGSGHVIIADALADGVRSIVRVSSAGSGPANSIAARLGMPPWIAAPQSQARLDRGGSGARAERGRRPQRRREGQRRRPDYALERAVGS
jgi:DNA polymerase-3 subunit delta